MKKEKNRCCTLPEDLEAMTLNELQAVQEMREAIHDQVFILLVEERDKAQEALSDYVQRGHDISRAILKKMEGRRIVLG